MTVYELTIYGVTVLLIEQSYDDIVDGLESWDWIDFSEKSPFITTDFGDVFLNQMKVFFSR